MSEASFGATAFSDVDACSLQRIRLLNSVQPIGFKVSAVWQPSRSKVEVRDFSSSLRSPQGGRKVDISVRDQKGKRVFSAERRQGLGVSAIDVGKGFPRRTQTRSGCFCASTAVVCAGGDFGFKIQSPARIVHDRNASVPGHALRTFGGKVNSMYSARSCKGTKAGGNSSEMGGYLPMSAQRPNLPRS